MRGAIVAAVLLAALAATALATERFPPPDFTNHRLPEPLPNIQAVQPRALAWDYVDVAVLAAALAAASYFALAKRWRRGLLGLSVVSLAWFGFWRQGCVCPIGAIQNVTLALVDSSYAIPVSLVLIFALPLLFTFIFGRTFCAAVCPLGAAQELAVFRPVKVHPALEHALGLIPYVYLGAAVLYAATGTAFVVCQYDPFVSFFRRSGSVNMLVFGGCVLVIGMFVGRPYCRYLCPLGAIFRLISPLAKWHVRVPPDECINCRLCEDACPYGAIRQPTADLSADQRLRGRGRLAALVLLLPLVVAAGWAMGRQSAEALAHLNPTWRLAERVYQEKTGAVEGTTDASDAFRNTGRPAEELYREADELRKRFAFAGGLLGAWAGLVVGLKLIQLSRRPRRTEYAADRSGCVSCGRCFWYCPKEQARLGLLTETDRP
jgi:ferredoxin